MSTSQAMLGREHIECDSPSCCKPNPPERCSCCQRAYYCNAICQRAHWGDGHREECFDVNIIREQVVNIGKGAVSDGEVFYDAETDRDVKTEEGESPATVRSHNTCCFICLSETIVDPYTLPRCGHSFCFGCLQHWQAVASTLACPACRVDAPDIAEAIHETALLYAARASRSDLSEEERTKYSELALTELNRFDESSIDPVKKVRTLFTKAEVLQQLKRPADALKALKELEEVDQQGVKNFAEIKRLLDAMDAAEEEGRHADSDAIIDKLEAMKESHAHISRLENSGFDLYIKIAECKEAMEDYEGALEVYKFKIMAVIDYDGPDNVRGTPPQQRMMFMGMSRCMYHLKNYEYAIQLGEAAIEMNRHFPQVHKYVALSQKDSGDIEGAIRTMARAVNYETPWDEANRKIVIKMYEEMKNSSVET